MTQTEIKRPLALVTGASRAAGIGAAIALKLAEAGWDVATTYWRAYDKSMPWGSKDSEAEAIAGKIGGFSARSLPIEADLADPASPAKIFDSVEAGLGPVTALIMAHCHSVDSDIAGTSLESFELHFNINARAAWLLIKEFGRRYCGGHGDGRIVSITSDHTARNLPYGASKGAMDRIVLAAAYEFQKQGITANVINPGATDTAWMSAELMDQVRQRTLLDRIGQPQDCANLVKFLCSQDGGWMNGQLLYSNGGLKI